MNIKVQVNLWLKLWVGDVAAEGEVVEGKVAEGDYKY
jgi:hypothetical protein